MVLAEEVADRRMVIPGRLRSTMNWLVPACRCSRSSGRVRQNRIMKWQWVALVVHSLVPSTRQPSPSRTALVRTEARSEPESGSLMPMQKKHAPAAIRGRIALFCASVP